MTNREPGGLITRPVEIMTLDPVALRAELRKAISRRMADAEIGNAGIKSVTLHSRDDEVALYVAAADQKRLARTSIDRISQWEVSNLTNETTANPSQKAKK